jgi:hypothetical protein
MLEDHNIACSGMVYFALGIHDLIEVTGLQREVKYTVVMQFITYKLSAQFGLDLHFSTCKSSLF